MSRQLGLAIPLVVAGGVVAALYAQVPPVGPPPAGAPSSVAQAGRGAPPGPPGPGGRGAAPPWLAAVALEEKAVERFDTDKNGWLNVGERRTAREVLAKEAAARPPLGLPAPRPGEPTRPGPRVTPADVPAFPGRPAFDPDIVRTFFLEFEDQDWEKALTEFRRTDVDVPATLTIDGQQFKNVGVHYRGASSFLFVGEGRKRSLNLALDYVEKPQQFGGYKTFNLLNANGDPTLLKGFLYFHVARQYVPTPKVNFAKVVINGEYWGVYPNVQQEDRDFIAEWWKTSNGTRWKAPGSPWAQAGLNYIGDNVEDYRKLYEIKGKDDPKAWAALIELCRVLSQTPLDQLERRLEPIFDVDRALRFLALESAFINDDGYWVRASDYNLYRDETGRFTIYPHDGNEAFYDLPPNMREGAARGVELDPFAGSADPMKVLLNRMLAVPSLRTRYLAYLKDIATNWLDWNRLGPIARKYQALIDADVRADTRKLASYAEFRALVEGDHVTQGPNGPVTAMGIKTFAEERRAFLLSYPAIKALP